MVEYLSHWWNGNLGIYHPLGLTIAQLNKICKIAMYSIGLLTIFEIMTFVQVIERIKWLTYIMVYVINIQNKIYNFPITISQSIISALYTSIKNRNINDILNALRGSYYKIRDNLDEESRRDPLVKALEWLEQRKVAERKIKSISFILLIIFSLAEILTST